MRQWSKVQEMLLISVAAGLNISLVRLAVRGMPSIGSGSMPGRAIYLLLT